MIHQADNVVDLNAILHPATVFDHPRDVVADATLSISEKRAILASWASDAAAVASNPALRELAGTRRAVHYRRDSGSAVDARLETAGAARRQADAAKIDLARSAGGVAAGSIAPKSCGQPLGEGWPRANRSGTGRGGDVTGSRVLKVPVPLSIA